MYLSVSILCLLISFLFFRSVAGIYFSFERFPKEMSFVGFYDSIYHSAWIVLIVIFEGIYQLALITIRSFAL